MAKHIFVGKSVVLNLFEGPDLRKHYWEKREEKKPHSWRDSNPRPLCYEACALPLCYNHCFGLGSGSRVWSLEGLHGSGIKETVLLLLIQEEQRGLDGHLRASGSRHRGHGVASQRDRGADRSHSEQDPGSQLHQDLAEQRKRPTRWAWRLKVFTVMAWTNR